MDSNTVAATPPADEPVVYRIVLSTIMTVSHVTAMCKALRAAGFEVERSDREHATATMKNGVVVFMALRVRSNIWIVRRANGLFTEDGVPDEIVKKIMVKLNELRTVNRVSVGARVS